MSETLAPKNIQPQSKGARRRLAGGKPQSSAQNLCLACAWRRTSNGGLRDLVSRSEGQFPADYSGVLSAFYQGQVIVAQYQRGRQEGFIAIPIQNFEDVNRDLVGVYTGAVEEVLEAVRASLPEGSDEEDEEEVASDGDDDTYDADGFVFGPEEPEQDEEEEEF